MTTDDASTATADAPAPPARRRRARRTDGDSGPAPRRARRAQASGEDLVAQLTTMVDPHRREPRAQARRSSS